MIIKLNNNGKFELSAIKKLNLGDRDFVIYYLLKGASQENPESIKTLSELYNNGWGVPKDLKKGDSLQSVYVIWCGEGKFTQSFLVLRNQKNILFIFLNLFF